MKKKMLLINTIWAALYHVLKKGACYLKQETSTTRLAWSWEKTKHNVGYPKRDKQNKKSKNFGP